MSYITYSNKIQYDIIQQMLKNDDLLKLLYYDVESPLSCDKLTSSQKRTLLKESKEVDVFQRIFTTRFDPDYILTSKNQIRIFKKYKQQYDNPLLVKVYFFFEIMVYRENEIIEDGLRSELILNELIKSTKGLQAIGQLTFSKDTIEPITFGKGFSGFVTYASVCVLKEENII